MSFRVGRSTLQRSKASGQRVRKQQPLGRSSAEGTSPVSSISSRGRVFSIDGAAESSARV
jgi:hypothetical protein